MYKYQIKISEKQVFIDIDTTYQIILIRSLSLLPFEKKKKTTTLFSIPLTEKYLTEVLQLMLCWL